MAKTLCLYAYYEKNQEYRDNLIFFIEHGLNTYSDYLFVISGTSTVTIPSLPHVRVVQRYNSGFDFGAWSNIFGTDAIVSDVVDNYDYFIFINTSVRGPFCNGIWQHKFTDMINHDVKLVGTTINVCTSDFKQLEKLGFSKPYTHVQSQLFAMDKECLDFLIEAKIFEAPTPDHSFQDIIELKEVGMSQYVLRNGWNINCILPKYRNIDYRKVKTNFNFSSVDGDPSYCGAYFGESYSHLDVIFIKTNRNLHVPKLRKTKLL